MMMRCLPTCVRLCILLCTGRRSVTDGGAWLAYSTAEQVVGLIVWPLDGDPQHSMGVIAHPGEVRGLALSFDGRKLVTLGKSRPQLAERMLFVTVT
jgi:hypothetical protein